MPGPAADGNGKKSLLPPINAVPSSALLEPKQENNEGFSPTPAYGTTTSFVPLGGDGGSNDWQWGEVCGSEFLCALCWMAVA